MTNRILSCPFPENLNPLSPNGFKFSIDKLPELSYFCQEVTIPDIVLGDIFQSNPLTNIAIPGDQVTYSALSVVFLVDANMANYKAIHQWITGLGFPKDNQQYIDQLASARNPTVSASGNAYSDGVMAVLDNANNVVTNIHFVDLVPVTLGGLTFTSTSQDVQYLVGRADFRYTYYEFI